MTRPSWGHVSRICERCGKVGPRVPNPTGFGYIHDYCRSDKEKSDERKTQRAKRKKVMATAAVAATLPRDRPAASEWPFPLRQ